jgi:hypothetical protein
METDGNGFVISFSSRRFLNFSFFAIVWQMTRAQHHPSPTTEKVVMGADNQNALSLIVDAVGASGSAKPPSATWLPIA